MDTYLTLTAAARRIGTTRILLRRRVARGDIATFEDPLDDRKKLVRVSDLDRLRQPRPIHPAPVAPGDATA